MSQQSKEKKEVSAVKKKMSQQSRKQDESLVSYISVIITKSESIS